MKNLAAILILITLFFPLTSHAFLVSPVVIDDIAVWPGGERTVTITIASGSSETMEIFWEVQEFVAKGESGEQEYIAPLPGGITEWLTIEEEQLLVLPGETKQVTLNINVPENAEPGGHYATVFFTQKPAGFVGEGVGLVTKIGIPVLVLTYGEVVENLNLKEFKVAEDQKLFSNLPVVFESRVENVGSVHLKPAGSIKISKLFGLVDHDIAANPNGSNVLPNSTRLIESAWTKLDHEEPRGFWESAKHQWRNLTFGCFKAELVMNYGEDNETLTDSTRFYVVPWQLVSSVLAVLIGFIILVTLYNRMIIKKAVKKKRK